VVALVAAEAVVRRFLMFVLVEAAAVEVIDLLQLIKYLIWLELYL
jgi:hypothetical protein